MKAMGQRVERGKLNVEMPVAIIFKWVPAGTGVCSQSDAVAAHKTSGALKNRDEANINLNREFLI